jgi:hypothetical protein
LIAPFSVRDFNEFLARIINSGRNAIEMDKLGLPETASNSKANTCPTIEPTFSAMLITTTKKVELRIPGNVLSSNLRSKS